MDKEKITDKELITFCEKLENSIIEKDPSIFNQSLFEAGLQKKVFEGYQAGGALNYALNQTLNHQFKLGDGILSMVLNGDFIFEVTKIYRDKKDNPWAVFRLFNGANFNYIEFQFQKVLGEIRITEGYYYNSGQSLSKTIRNLVFLELGFDGKGKSDANIIKYYQAGLDFLMRANKQMLFGDFEKALDEFEYMDKRLEAEPYFFTQKLNILSYLDEERMYQNLKRFDQLYPNEKRFNTLNAVQLYMHEGEVEKTRKAIHELSKFVGNDAVLDYYEANALMNNGDYEKAIFYFDKFIEQRPNLSFGYLGKANSYIRKKDYEQATFSLKKILKKFDVDIKRLEKMLVQYPDFLNSEEYELWKKGAEML